MYIMYVYNWIPYCDMPWCDMHNIIMHGNYLHCCSRSSEMGLEEEPPPLPARNYSWSDMEDNDDELFQSDDDLDDTSAPVTISDHQKIYSSVRALNLQNFSSNQQKLKLWVGNILWLSTQEISEFLKVLSGFSSLEYTIFPLPLPLAAD